MSIWIFDEESEPKAIKDSDPIALYWSQHTTFHVAPQNQMKFQELISTRCMVLVLKSIIKFFGLHVFIFILFI